MSRAYLLDLLERVVFTFAEAFAAVLIASGAGISALPSVSVLDKAGVAGLAAVVALIKGLLAHPIGAQDSAGIVPDPTPVAPAVVAEPVVVPPTLATDSTGAITGKAA